MVYATVLTVQFEADCGPGDHSLAGKAAPWRLSIGPPKASIGSYDLRATPDRCPECGTQQASA